MILSTLPILAFLFTFVLNQKRIIYLIQILKSIIMKRVTLFFLATFVAFAMFAQNAAETTKSVANPNAPEITFDKTVHDYGTIPYQGDGKCEFKFTNTGKEPLILTNVRSSCGCTVPKWPREPILPGQSDIIKVEYKTNRIGKINKTITVQSNARTSSLVLRIEGQVLKPEQETTPANSGTLGTSK